MARYRIGADLEFETVTPGELADAFSKQEQQQWEHLRGRKLRRIPTMRGTVTAAGITFGGDTGQPQIGPTQGNLWMMRYVTINGLAFGATPDQVNMQIFGAGAGPQGGSINWLLLTGNVYFFKWGYGELWMNSGEYLGIQSQGTVAAAIGSQITFTGSVLQVPAELAAGSPGS